jgi:hypothetical protein
MKQARPGGTMNRTIDTTTSEQRGIGGIDDGVNRQSGDVSLNYTNNMRHGVSGLPMSSTHGLGVSLMNGILLV